MKFITLFMLFPCFFACCVYGAAERDSDRDVLRAVGIPTRMIIVIPFVDPSDKEQLNLIRERITHHKVRKAILSGIGKPGQSFTAHTLNEVYVGNRWYRLNYNKLGQPILD